MSDRTYKLRRVYKNGKRRIESIGRAEMADCREFANDALKEPNVVKVDVLLHNDIVYTVPNPKDWML